MRLIPLLVGAALLVDVAQAQVAPPSGGAAGSPPLTATAPAASPEPSAPAARASRPHRGRRTLAERFDAANTTHDGKLTLAQARAGHMNAVARDFDKIDKDKRGYVGIDDIRAFQKERREARRAARQGQSQPQ